MRLLIDTNVLLDVLQKRAPHYEASSMLWKLCETEQSEGFVSALSIADLVYIMHRELSPDTIDEVIRRLSLIFRIADLTADDLRRASSLRWRDFEDALQVCAAQRLHADAIITRNGADFAQSPVPALSPAQFLAGM